MNKEKFLRNIQSYQGISSILKTCSYQEIAAQVAEFFSIEISKLEDFPMGGYSRGRTSGAYRFVLQDLLKNIEHFDWLFSRLQDEESKRVFTHLMQFRMIPDHFFIEQAYDGKNSQYFDPEIIFCDSEEVFVDCGGFTGDTTEKYIQIYQNYKQIYVYEPSTDNIAICRKNLQYYPNITVRNCGVGEKNKRMSMINNHDASSFCEGISDDLTEVVALDEDIEEKVTFIKMDVEGFEIPALIGAKRHIREEKPKLAICTYHIVSDLWEIPRLIDSISSDYQFYIRHYEKTQNWETVLYAIPVKERENRKEQKNLIERELKQEESKKAKRKKVVAISAPEAGWYNSFLTKDCGIIPYLLYKNHHCDVFMLGAKMEEYPYLNSYVKGLKMEYLSTGSEEEKIEYIQKHASEIDALLLRGAYPCNFIVARVYKKINPEGKICLGLDANSFWMDQILWKEENFLAFMNCCDIITAAGRTIQNYLNEKWSWKIEYIPNGYYPFGYSYKKPVFEKKKNIILTVGRLGTAQKATEVLMEAFAFIAEEIPDFQLRLVGSIEKTFEGYIENYWKRYPQLKRRVIFVGMIQDKEELAKEYWRAKIFALPSRVEGVANVIAEALSAGCVTAVTKIDEWQDATDTGRCGMVAEIDDTIGFSKILLNLCKREDLSNLSDHAYQYAKENYDMELVVAKVNELLFGGE